LGKLKRKIAEREADGGHKKRQKLEEREDREALSPAESNDRFSLPKIPSEWTPSNVSVAEKRTDLIEKAKRTEGFPNTDEDFYSTAEIEQMERYEARIDDFWEKERAKALIIQRAGKPLGQISRDKLRQLQDELNIDPINDRVRPALETTKKSKVSPEMQSSAASATMGGGLGHGDRASSSAGPDRVQDAGIQASPSRKQNRRSLKGRKRKATDADDSETLSSPKRKKTRWQAPVQEALEEEFERYGA